MVIYSIYLTNYFKLKILIVLTCICYSNMLATIKTQQQTEFIKIKKFFKEIRIFY